MDSLENEIPAFDKPENIPLVVPDLPAEKKPRKLRVDHCAGTTKHGTPCGFAHQKESLYCIAHDPAISDEQRNQWRKLPKRPRTGPMGRPPLKPEAQYKSREEILEILSKRLDIWMEKFGNILSVGVDDAICDLCRTYAVVAKVEVAEGAEVRGWRMRGTA